MHPKPSPTKKAKLGSKSRKGKNQKMTKHKLKRKENRENMRYPI
jgi:hypothetical protein